ncbi:MAG: topoisomerase C-terminal repeat-containing protein, partial [Rhodospirillales bacterium]
MDPTAIDLEKALGLLALPRDVGPEPDTGEMITAGIGRYGPYIKLGGTYVSLKGEDDVLTIGLNRAVHLLAGRPRKAPPKTLGDHPKDGKPVIQKAGRWGPYVQHGSMMATLPKGTDLATLTLDDAVGILSAKAAKGGGQGKSKAKKKPAKKAKKKPAARKPAEGAAANEPNR